VASPQLEDGHISIAMEIWEALTAYRIPGEQMQCLMFILRKTYGWKKKQDSISLSQFMDATGMKKSSVARALKGLLSKKIIRVIKKDNAKVKTYEFIKNFEQWAPAKKKQGVLKKEYRVLKKEHGVLKKEYQSSEHGENTEEKQGVLKKEYQVGGGTQKGKLGVLKKVNPSFTKKSTTKETTTKETIQKKTAFQENAADAVAVGKNGKSYLSKKGRKLKGRTLETFNEFWEAFDWKKDKSSAADAWLYIQRRDEILNQIIAGAKTEAARRPELLKTNSSPKWAQGWLTARRWEDEIGTSTQEEDPWDKL